jgi:hypothetical protein
MDFLRPVLGRVIASVLAAFFGWLAAKWQISVDPQTQEATVVALTGGVTLVIYGILHKFFNLKLNPLDTASVTMSKPSSATIVKAQVASELPIAHEPTETYLPKTLDEYQKRDPNAPPSAPHIPDDGI